MAGATGAEYEALRSRGQEMDRGQAGKVGCVCTKPLPQPLCPMLHPQRRWPETESLTQTYLSGKEFTGSLTKQPREGQFSVAWRRPPLLPASML